MQHKEPQNLKSPLGQIKVFSLIFQNTSYKVY